MMWALIKKDLRLNLLLIASAALFSAMPYALAAANLVVNPPDHKVVETRDYVQTLDSAGYACLILMVIMSSAFGGSSFALERRERSAEFLGMLPVSRQRIVISKALVGVLCVTLFVLVHLVALQVIDSWARSAGLRRRDHQDYLTLWAFMAFTYASLLFCVGWAMSVRLRSPAVAATIAMLVGAAFLFGLTPVVLTWLERWDDRMFRSEDRGFLICDAMAVLVALASMLFSTLRYVRRVEP